VCWLLRFVVVNPNGVKKVFLFIEDLMSAAEAVLRAGTASPSMACLAGCWKSSAGEQGVASVRFNPRPHMARLTKGHTN
jgi:hypothetical protein